MAHATSNERGIAEASARAAWEHALRYAEGLVEVIGQQRHIVGYGYITSRLGEAADSVNPQLQSMNEKRTVGS